MQAHLLSFQLLSLQFSGVRREMALRADEARAVRAAIKVGVAASRVAVGVLSYHTASAVCANWSRSPRHQGSCGKQATRQTSSQAIRQTSSQASRQSGRQAARQSDRQAARQSDRQAARQAGNQADKQPDKQATRQDYSVCDSVEVSLPLMARNQASWCRSG